MALISDYLVQGVQMVLVLALAPLLTGVVRKVKARLLRRRGASIALEPANASYEVRILPPNRVRIQGKMVAMFRRY